MKILHISESIKGGISTYLSELYENKTSNDKFYFFLPESQAEYQVGKFKTCDSNNPNSEPFLWRMRIYYEFRYDQDQH